jgi:ectoine hydroxylase-related dioxygenase (phytanoyl-CoA dioxygenase family)
MTTEAKAFFDEHGYYLAKSVFNAQEVADLEQAFDAIVDTLLASGEEANARWKGQQTDAADAGNTVVLHTHNPHQYASAWLQAYSHPKLLEILKALLGPDVVLHHSKLFQKPPETGAAFPLHQDWSYFPTEQDSMLAGIIHVSQATDEMGCLRVVPGSHRLGRRAGTSGQGDHHSLQDYRLEDALPLEAEPGDVAFFHYFTLHGSMPNRSPRTRKTVLIQAHAGSDRPEPNGHPYERLVLSGFNRHATRSGAGMAKA